ncbi:hypothetical protein GOBAR_DD04485 [Gossypium barbadense]|nr:hypothetical protein GOBAR_DD04485 [Gossypium barbadense]
MVTSTWVPHGRWWDCVPPDVVVSNEGAFRVSYNLYVDMGIGLEDSHVGHYIDMGIGSQNPYVGLTRPNNVGISFGPNDAGQRFGPNTHDVDQGFRPNANLVCFEGPTGHRKSIRPLGVRSTINDVSHHS